MTEKKPITLAGVPIRMGKLKKKLARAKRSGDSELQMELQQSMDDLLAEKGRLEAFEAANPPGAEPEKPAAAAAPAAAVSPGLSPQEAALAVRTIVGMENKMLSAVAGQRFEMKISEADQKGMEEALSLAAAKRLTSQQKEKMDLLFLVLAFAVPLVEAIPAAVAMRKASRPRPAEVEKEEAAKSLETKPVAVPVAAVVDIAGPMPSKVN